MQFPHPMTEQKFNNDYDIIVCALSLSIRRFQKEDIIFATQCIWWLASIIQYTEILKFYLQYQVLPSEYIENCVVTPLAQPSDAVDHNSDIPEIQLDLDMDYHTKTIQQDVAEVQSILPNNRRTCSSRMVKSVNLPTNQLQKRYPRRSQQQPNSLRVFLQKDSLIL